MWVRAFEARHGATVLLAGKSDSSTEGLLLRWSLAAGFVRLTTKPNTTFTSVCRVSDAEGWAVGSTGAPCTPSLMGAVSVASPTTKDLLSVDCVAGAAVVGVDGTVLRAVDGVWAAAQPAFHCLRQADPLPPRSAQRCWRLVTAYFSGSRARRGPRWSRPETSLGSWPAARTRCTRRWSPPVRRRPTPGASAVLRFDGAQWVPMLAVQGVLAEGVEAGPRVVFGGTGGLLVEGR